MVNCKAVVIIPIIRENFEQRGIVLPVSVFSLEYVLFHAFTNKYKNFNFCNVEPNIVKNLCSLSIHSEMAVYVSRQTTFIHMTLVAVSATYLFTLFMNFV